MIARNVEYMRVQLIVRNNNITTTPPTITTATIGINDYLALAVDSDNTTATPAHRPAITGINLGLLTRSNETVPNGTVGTYKILDKTLTAPTDTYMRHVYTTTVALRNGGLGDTIP